MASTTTDIASIVASVGGLAVAVVGILSEPLNVDSSRPTIQNSNSGLHSPIATARLWDDPFAPFTAEKPEPITGFTEESGNTLVLVAPVDTQLYEEDRESRLRTRFAIQRALLDAGFAPIQASILQGLTLHFSHKEDATCSQATQSVWTLGTGQSQTSPTTPVAVLHRSAHDQANGSDDVIAPIQLFELRPMVQALPNRTGIGQFRHVVIVWLPDSVLWKDDYRYNIFTAIDCELGHRTLTAQARPVYVLLGPWDSDELARLQITCKRHGGDVIQKPPQSSRASIVSYRATVAEPLLHKLTSSAFESSNSAAASTYVAYKRQHNLDQIYRLTAHDDLLCRALLKEIAFRGSGLLGKRQMRILVFSEWDTLYGRSLAETFRALANCDEKLSNVSDVSFQDLRQALIKANPDLAKPYVRAGPDPSFSITVVPYLRGLDGTSTLYSKAYPHLSEADSKDHRKDLALEPAEGTTQFDYLRRSTSSMLQQPVAFIPSADRPDAIVIFGSDVYDKLILLKFLKQTLRNCLYMTTDLDALYWHPDYLQYSKDLVVASAFPLEMASSSSALAGSGDASVTSPIRFRDTYQSAAYWSVIRILEAGQDPIGQWISEDPESVKTFRIGNSEPLQIGGDLQSWSDTQRGSTKILARNLNWINAFLEKAFTPIMQGVSPFWAMLIQCVMIGLAALALFKDIPQRTVFPLQARDRIWEVAINLLPTSECQREASNFQKAIREKWARTKRIRDPKGDAGFYAQNPPRPSITIPAGKEPEQCRAIIKHFESRLATAETKTAVVRLGLSFFSTVFDLYAAAPRTEDPIVKDGKTEASARWNKEISPIVNYMESHRVYRDVLASEDQTAPTVPPMISKAWGMLSSLFPSWTFFFTSVLTMLLIGAICAQPDVYFVGSETRTPILRAFRSLVETLAILFSFGVFYRVCFEQLRFRRLIKSLSELTSIAQTGLSNRRIVVILSEASEPITRLSFTPCALALLLFLSHLRPLGGVPIMVEIWTLLVFGLAVLAYFFFSLRSAALSELESIRRSYEDDVVTSTRLITRLNSFATDVGPLQDTEASLVGEIKALIEKNSDVPLPSWFQRAMAQINRKTFRNRICTYLQSCRERNKEIISQLEAANQGVFTPLFSSPALTALLLPIGGAGGISLLSWLLTLSK